jgi:hypothetical protein
MINMSAIYSREREMRGCRRCVNAGEFESSAAPAVPKSTTISEATLALRSIDLRSVVV